METAAIAVISPTPVEYEEMSKAMDETHPAEDQTLPARSGKIGSFKVICVQGGKGEKYTASAITSVSNRWNPRWIMLAGIAGGFPSQGLERGDVVIANFIYDMDFGKLENGRYLRRPEYDFKPDLQLLEHAKKLAEAPDVAWVDKITAVRPDGQPTNISKAKVGYVATSDKVVDDPDHEFFKSVQDTIPEIAAVEMEASGAGAAIHLEQSRRLIGFLMVRGISDTPVRSTEACLGTQERKAWKQYASAAAATFVRTLIESLSAAQVLRRGDQLSFNDKALIVDLLLDCAALQDHNMRDSVVRLLRPQIRYKISRGGAARLDVMNILETCIDYSGGLAELIEAVKFYERDSEAMAKLEEQVGSITLLA